MSDVAVIKTDIEIKQSEVEPLIDDVARHHKVYAKKALMSAFGGYWGKRVKDVARKLIWDAGMYSSLAWEVLDRLVNRYMNYYNFQRYQWNLKKMTPVQYRDHLLTK